MTWHGPPAKGADDSGRSGPAPGTRAPGRCGALVALLATVLVALAVAGPEALAVTGAATVPPASWASAQPVASWPGARPSVSGPGPSGEAGPMARPPAGTHHSRVAGTPTPAAAEEKDSAKIASTAWGGAREGAGGKARPGRFWPVEGAEGARRPRVPRGWDPPPQPWAPGHRGVDLAARPGQPVRAVADGKVSFAGKVAGRGVVVDRAD
ncbi:peptidoglycan DD-metalloendopeptidase family protein [Streptomyces albus]